MGNRLEKKKRVERREKSAEGFDEPGKTQRRWGTEEVEGREEEKETPGKVAGRQEGKRETCGGCRRGAVLAAQHLAAGVKCVLLVLRFIQQSTLHQAEAHWRAVCVCVCVCALFLSAGSEGGHSHSRSGGDTPPHESITHPTCFTPRWASLLEGVSTGLSVHPPTPQPQFVVCAGRNL